MQNYDSVIVEMAAVITGLLMPLGYLFCKNLMEEIREAKKKSSPNKNALDNLFYFIYGSDLTLVSLVINAIGLILIIIFKNKKAEFLIWFILFVMFVVHLWLIIATRKEREWPDYNKWYRGLLFLVVLYYAILIIPSMLAPKIQVIERILQHPFDFISTFIFVVLVLHIPIWLIFSIKYKPITNLGKL